MRAHANLQRRVPLGCASIFALFMKMLKNIGRLLTEARRLEQADDLPGAAGVYEQVLHADPFHQQAVARLLTIYRRLKDYKKELRVIENALAAYKQRDKALREKWISDHPHAARVGQKFLKSLGGTSVSAFGSNSDVERLLKRKAVVEKRLGRPAPKKTKAKVVSIDGRAATAAARKEAAERKKQETAARKASAEAMAAAKAEAEIAAQPSLFVITLRYLVPLEKIDAMLPRHAAYLEKQYAKGNFLVSGRMVPRTGGIIIARGKDLAAVERITRQDPFVKEKLASIDIVEFKASKTGPAAKGKNSYFR